MWQKLKKGFQNHSPVASNSKSSSEIKNKTTQPSSDKAGRGNNTSLRKFDFDACEKASTARNIIADVSGVKHALIISITYPGSKNPLPGTTNDARRVINLLVRKFGFVESNVVVLSDDPMFPNSKAIPTKKAMVAYMQSSAAILAAGDLLFFGFFGHGSSAFDFGLDESDWRDECFVGADGKLLRDDVNKALLITAMPARARLVALVDCCMSGTIFDLPYEYTSGDQIRVYHNYQLESGERDAIVISACSDGESASELEDKSTGQRYGHLTRAFCHVLETADEPSTTISCYQLINAIAALTPRSALQTPTVSVTREALFCDYFQKGA